MIVLVNEFSQLEFSGDNMKLFLPSPHPSLFPCRHLAVPLPVGDCVFSLTWLLPTYFLFAVTYDVLQTLADVAHYLSFYSHSQEGHDLNLTGSLAVTNLSLLL